MTAAEVQDMRDHCSAMRAAGFTPAAIVADAVFRSTLELYAFAGIRLSDAEASDITRNLLRAHPLPGGVA